MASGGATESAIPVIDLPPSKSAILLDSSGRKPSETPYHFTTTLNAGVACDAITYKNLNWCQPIYSHSALSSEFMFDLLLEYDPNTGAAVNKWYPGYSNNEDYLNTHYVIYHKPYQMSIDFDGNDEMYTGGPFAPPKANSYAYDVEYALNYDVRESNNNLIQFDLTTLFPSINFQFRYSKSNGFRLTATYVKDGITRPCVIRLWDCKSIQIAHRVHGFGVLSNWNPLDINRGVIKSTDFINSMINNNNKVWLPAWLTNYATNNDNISNLIHNNGIDLSSPTVGYSLVNYSDSIPTLIPLEYIQVFCPELTFNKKLQSFRNISAVSQYGNNEVAIFPLLLDNACNYHTLTVNDDSHVWSIREGYAPQQLTIVITNEDGEDIICDDCWKNYFDGYWTSDSNIIPVLYYWPFTNPEFAQLRDDKSMNYLLFGVTGASYGRYNFTDKWGNPAAQALKTSDVIHFFITINA